jgi:hypothetical protein
LWLIIVTWSLKLNNLIFKVILRTIALKTTIFSWVCCKGYKLFSLI